MDTATDGMRQLRMTGPLWESPQASRESRGRRAHARAQARRAQAGRTFATRMEAALRAGEAFRSACRACGEEVSRADDTRNVLVDGLREYSTFLRSKYGQ